MAGSIKTKRALKTTSAENYLLIIKYRVSYDDKQELN